jgi:hypothetical protein
MTAAFYTHPNLPTVTLAHKDGAWWAIPNTLTSPAVAWSQRRPMPAQSIDRLTKLPDDGLFARMMIGPASQIMDAAEFRAGRKSLGLTQPQASDAFGISLRQYKTWEADGPSPLAARYMAALLSGYRPDDWPDGGTDDGN